MDRVHAPNSAPRSPRAAAVVLALALAGFGALALRVGSQGTWTFAEIGRGLLAALDLGEDLPGLQQIIFELRLTRLLTAAGVGAALAFSGALLQGVFRNDLASPGILGLTTGASLGASLAILLLGGYGPALLMQRIPGSTPIFVSLSAFLGAVGVALIVTSVATTGGRISVPTLLLVGIAINAAIGGLLATIQSFVLRDFEVARAVFAWGFGTLDDRAPVQIGILWVGVAIGALAIPFVAKELDLLASGEEDATALGVDVVRVRAIALLVASLAAGLAVAVAGQIAFIGLIVPHLLRLAVTRSHRALLPLCLLGGPVFLIGTDWAQRTLLGASPLPPGALMSLFGGPFFLFLLLRNRARIQAW